MNRRRHFSGCARHAPVRDQRDAMPAILQHAQRRRELVQFRHAVRARTLEAHHGDEIAIEFAAFEGRLHIVLIVEHDGRRFDDEPIVRHRGNLDRRRADISVKHAQPAIAAERFGGAAQHRSTCGSRRARACGEPCRRRAPLRLRYALESFAEYRVHVFVQQSRIEQLRRSGIPCRPPRGNDSRPPIHSDTRAPAAARPRTSHRNLPSANPRRPRARWRRDATDDSSIHRLRAVRSRH